MVLITGGTGFIGSALVRRLTTAGGKVRILLHPSSKSPRLPKGIALETALCSLNDERGLLAAMKGVDTVYHFASAERENRLVDLNRVDVQGTDSVIRAASDAHVKRFIFSSQIGADKKSLFPSLKAKALAEEIIQTSGLNYTIFRSSAIFGPNDHFTESIRTSLRSSKVIFPIPGSSEITIQPLWIEDFLTCLSLAIGDEKMRRRIITVGGGEYFNFRQFVTIIMDKAKIRRWLIPISPAYLRTFNLWSGKSGGGFPYSNTWLDYFAADRTCPLDTLPKVFGLIPARFEKNIDYLEE